jgi:hypothetical protein
MAPAPLQPDLQPERSGVDLSSLAAILRDNQAKALTAGDMYIDVPNSPTVNFAGK